MTTKEFAFDTKLFATIRVRAATEGEARALLQRHIDAITCTAEAWPDGSPCRFEASIDDGHPELVDDEDTGEDDSYPGQSPDYDPAQRPWRD